MATGSHISPPSVQPRVGTTGGPPPIASKASRTPWWVLFVVGLSTLGRLEEPDDGAHAPVGRQRGDVEAGGDARAGGVDEVPAEADDVVVGVGPVAGHEAMAGKLRPRAADHRRQLGGACG